MYVYIEHVVTCNERLGTVYEIMHSEEIQLYEKEVD